MNSARRKLLAGSAVITAGAAIGAFTPAGLTAMARTMSEDAFVDRFDRVLNESEIRDLVVGKTMEGVTFKGGEFLAYIAPDGSVDKIVGDRRDSGTWSLQDDMLGMQFTSLAQGQPFALRIYQYRGVDLFKGWSPTEERWVWFVVQPGKASELA